MNLTDDQKDLLRTLVAVHQTSQFVLVKSHSGSTLIYQSGRAVPITFDDADFHQLKEERFITLSPNSAGELCGKPTQLGIEAVMVDFAPVDRRTAAKQIEPLVDSFGGRDSPIGGPTHPQISARAPLPAFQRRFEVPDEPSVADRGLDNREKRSCIVDAFILRCNQETPGRVIEKHIWLAVGHTNPRQFQYWKAGSDKATRADDQNFRRILNMNPSDFVTLLVKKRIIEA